MKMLGISQCPRCVLWLAMLHQIIFQGLASTIISKVGTLGVQEAGLADISKEYTFQYTDNEDFVVVTQVDGNATIDNPITFEVRQQKYSLSWQLPVEPIMDSGIYYRTANRTVCIDKHYVPLEASANSTERKRSSRKRTQTGNIVTVTVSTLSPTPVGFTLIVRNASHLLLINESRPLNVTTTSPEVMLFNFSPEEESNSSSVIIRISSNDTRCLTVSVQKPLCPVFDQETNVDYDGYYFTMSKKGAVTIRRDTFPDGFFLVLVLHSSDKRCLPIHAEDNLEDEESRIKAVQVVVEESISDSKFSDWVIFPIIFYGIQLFFVGFYPLCIAYRIRSKRLQNEDKDYDMDDFDQNETITASSSTRTSSTTAPPNTDVMLSQLTRWTPPNQQRHLEKKTFMFCKIVFIVGIYYMIPAMQLVIKHLSTSHLTGNLDLCYYNYECAVPGYIFRLVFVEDFNHVYSNIGYIFFGVVASILLSIAMYVQNHSRMEGHGVPAKFGISYAIALAIIFEGLLSSGYHVCPNKSNFTHDTCFMFIVAVLAAIKLYQGRHPHTNISSGTAFVLMSIVMLLYIGGEHWTQWWYFYIFSVFHLYALVILATQLYFLGRKPIFSKDLLKNIWAMIRNDRSGHSARNPIASPDVYHLIVFGMLVNIYGVMGYMGIYQFCTRDHFNYGTYILAIFGVNMGLYFLYYWAMKYKRGEKCMHIVAPFLWSVVLWVVGVRYFLDRKSSWEETPAISRMHNEPCEFFDSHDLWHLWSAAALAFTLLTLEVLDMDIYYKPHEEIHVF